MEKISIIVSAYNTEKYLEKCINSILNQSYKNIELLIVNDCSTDNTKKIIEKYEKLDSRIIFIDNKENRGLSFSRNEALKKSTGNYIGYIDSDDYIEENYYQSLLDSLVKTKSDIAICDINLLYENTGKSERVNCGNNKNETIDFINNGLAASVCNKLFKREVIEKYKFSEGKVNEDLAVTLPLLAEYRCIYNDEVMYNYVQRENSIQNSKISDKRFDIFYGVDLTIERFNGINAPKEYSDAVIYQQIINLFFYVLTEENNMFKRMKWFRKFNKLSKKYDLLNNKYYNEFINNLGKIKYYYKTLFKINSIGLCLLASIEVTIFKIFRRITRKNVIKKDINMNSLIKLSKKQQNKKQKGPTVSVVIPNYNYEKFMYQRLYSILNQNYKINEIIILDDCSTDNSRKLIDDIISKLKDYIDIKSIYNNQNSGSAFKQWEKGFKNAKSEYVWIAEADDYCNKKLLKTLINPILNDNDIVISYANTAFIDAQGKIIMRSVVPEIDIMKTGHWNNSFISIGKDEYKKYAFLNCTIANVSSCIIKNDNYDKEFEMSKNYKQAGDWLFYVNVMQKGKVAYNKNTLNYYRVHGVNVSSTMKKEAHLKEIKNIHDYYRSQYGLDDNQEKEIKKRYTFLKDAWKI